MVSNQGSPLSLRPNKGVPEYVAKKLKADGTLSEMFNCWLASLNDDSPALLKMQIDQGNKDLLRIDKEIAALTKEKTKVQEGIVFRQSRLNSFIHRNADVEEAQAAILKMWKATSKNTLKGETSFRNWITGPANLELMHRAGFKNDDQVVEWCKGVVPK
jgi:hypothetical protein